MERRCRNTLQKADIDYSTFSLEISRRIDIKRLRADAVEYKVEWLVAVLTR